MINIGVVGLDTSHPVTFASILKQHGETTITGVWDGGNIRDEEYMRSFCETYGATAHATPASMVNEVDGALVVTANWDRHQALAEPFLRAGVPVLIDKPLVGTWEAAKALERLVADTGTPVYGGSGVPFHHELQRLPVGVSERTLFCAGYNDAYVYGAHLVDTVRYLISSDWQSVSLADAPGLTVQIHFQNGSTATMLLNGPTTNGQFAFLDVATTIRTATVASMLPNANENVRRETYTNYLEGFLETIRGDRDDSTRVLDSARALLGVKAALDTEETVIPGSDALENVHADGATYVASYEPYGAYQ